MPHPTSDSAYGIWSLNEVRDAERGENWPSIPVLLEYLVIAGGGAGGAENDSGGGGAGGVVVAYSIPVTVQGYSIQVGNGGSGNNSLGNSGENSTAFGIVAAGGGTSGRHAGTLGTAGGSGGGAASTNNDLNTGGSTTGNDLNGYNGIIYGSRGGDQKYTRSANPGEV